jgi:membrane-bound metal-dependent hydrolase YbcI (DUF457 family)
MTRASHFAIGLAVGIDAVALQPQLAGLLTGLGILAGANLPDDLEIPLRGNPPRTLFPHRKLTHWPWPYVAIALALAALQQPVATLGAGVALGALIHLLCDAFSPHGIPIVSPFSARAPRHPIYKTHGASEWLLVAPAAASAILVATLRFETLRHVFAATIAAAAAYGSNALSLAQAHIR